MTSTMVNSPPENSGHPLSQITASSFLRPEVIAAQRVNWLGRPKLLQPLPILMVASMATIAICLVALLIIFGEYTRRVRVVGIVTPSAGVVRVVAPQAGSVINIGVAEGVAVRQGATLSTLGFDSWTSLGETGAIVLSQLEIQRQEILAEIHRRNDLDEIEKRELEDQEQALVREVEVIGNQINGTSDYVDVLRTLMKKHRLLAGQGITVQREFETRQQDFMQTRASLATLQRQRTQLDQRLIEVHARLASRPARTASLISDLKCRLSDIEIQIAQGEARRRVFVYAPREGVVTAILAQRGQFVLAGAPLLFLLPSGSKQEIYFSVPSSAIGFVKVGAQVLLRYAAFPYERFGQYTGSVTKVSRVTIQPGDAELALAGDPSMAGSYRVTVVPKTQFVTAYGQARPLQAGMQVETDILLDRRPLWKWVLEPLYSLRGRAADVFEDRTK
ncbi:efflux RND transporter periplasmic adaptor subunit [Rhizobium sp. RHZ02]|uniref:HlyD family secretion protein n=1 Tax=Rhizobium sp. RHZ02 TaxID=2769306 RepID=UPI00177FCC02|nr:efflux RND transporter periplasmic adaptor subunit [Rhizobium sp. RHZ02]MBD9454449.1 efflux RND transporter periplasmic adaptor subunit [Rhizobium sp. RHZ02]